MATRFIMDPKMKEQRETVAQILQLVEKKPYPTKETVHLAHFLESCFFVIEDVKRQELIKKQEQERIRKQKEEELRKKAEERERQKELEATAPVPENSLELPPLIEIPTLAELGLEDIPSPKKIPLEKREYVLQIYENPVGVLVEKESDGTYQYKLIEPNIEQSILDKAREMYGKEFERDNSLFDDQAFLKRVAEKVTNRLGIAYTDLIPQKIHYFLERDILGAGNFDPLLYDPKIKEIVCEGVNKNIKVNYNDLGIMETNVNITSNEDLNQFIKRLASASGKIISEQNPILETTFEGFKFEGTIGLGGASSRITIKRLIE